MAFEIFFADPAAKTFNYLEEQDNIDENKYDIKYIDINDIVNYIRLQ